MEENLSFYDLIKNEFRLMKLIPETTLPSCLPIWEMWFWKLLLELF